MTTDKLLPAIYTACFFFLVYTAVDVTATMWPWMASEPAWRTGFVTVTVSSMVTPILCALLLAWVALTYGKIWLGRILGTALVAGAVVLLIVLPFLLMDAVQLRQQVQPNVARSFEWNFVRTVLKLLGTTAIFGVLGVITLRGTRRAARRQEVRSATPSTLVADRTPVG